jgi:hypothetical protein
MGKDCGEGDHDPFNVFYLYLPGMTKKIYGISR